MRATITTGDDAVVLHTLKKNGESFVVNPSATVKCRLITDNHDVLSAPVTQSETSTGADWANSLIAVSFPSDVTLEVVGATNLWKSGKISAKLETQVDDNGKLTWYESIDIIKGTID